MSGYNSLDPLLSDARRTYFPYEHATSSSPDEFARLNFAFGEPETNPVIEFDEQILADLISQGLSGKDLLLKFKETRRKVRPAIEEILKEAHLAAQGKAPFATYEDVFGAGKTDE